MKMGMREREDKGVQGEMSVLKSTFASLQLLGHHNTVVNCLKVSE